MRLWSFKSAPGSYSMFVHVRLLAIWNTLWSACFANERLLTKLDQPCFSDEWRQISNLFRWWGILIPVLQTLVFFQMCMHKIRLLFLLSSPLSAINPCPAMAGEFNYSRWVSSHFRQNAVPTKAGVIFRGRSSVTKTCHINSLVKSPSTLYLCWLRSIAINVNKQVICFLVVINHVNDFGNLVWLMAEPDDKEMKLLLFQ